MHDPLVVAHEIPFPFPKRERWREKHYQGRRWGFTRRRRTNQENLGEPIYRWWRPHGWEFALAGRVYGMRRFATIWHVEPKGRDSGEVCRHYVRSTDPQPSRWRLRLDPFLKAHPRRDTPQDPAAGRPWIADRSWKWHVWHWSIQLPWLQEVRARLFDRCAECGRKGRPNVSHSWNGKKLGWWKFRSREGLYHSQCSGLMSLRTSRTEDEATIRDLVARLRLAGDRSEEDMINELAKGWSAQDRGGDHSGFRRGSRLAAIHGYAMRHSDARWVAKTAENRDQLI